MLESQMLQLFLLHDFNQMGVTERILAGVGWQSAKNAKKAVGLSGQQLVTEKFVADRWTPDIKYTAGFRQKTVSHALQITAFVQEAQKGTFNRFFADVGAAAAGCTELADRDAIFTDQLVHAVFECGVFFKQII
jgi:hypothetical protein